MRALCLVALTFTACGVDATLTTERESYQPGEAVTLTLTNRSLSPLGYNLCRAELRGPGGMRVENSNDGGFCTLILNRLEGGRSVTGTTPPLPGGVPEGHYRYRTHVEGPDGPLELLESTPFLLTP